MMKLNTEKCHLLISGNKSEHIWIKIGDNKILERNKVAKTSWHNY